MDGRKRQKDMTLEDKPPRLEGVQYATGEEVRAVTISFRKNGVPGLKRKQLSVVDVSSGESKVQGCKEYCGGIRNVRSMNQGILNVV